MLDGTSDLVVTKRVLDQTLKLGDCLAVMKTDIPARSVDVVVTLPPATGQSSLTDLFRARGVGSSVLLMLRSAATVALRRCDEARPE
jgi:hypothetical protein